MNTDMYALCMKKAQNVFIMGQVELEDVRKCYKITSFGTPVSIPILIHFNMEIGLYLGKGRVIHS